MKYPDPYIIDFSKIGKSDVGFISIAEMKNNIPFEIQRIFWTYYTPESISRGNHAHFDTQQILIAVAGSIELDLELPDGTKFHYKLDSPNIGIYIPPQAWHTMKYSHSSVQLVIASMIYDEKDYIREYHQFLKHYNG